MKNYWHYEGQKSPKDNKIFKYIRKTFFNNAVGISHSIISKEIYNKFIKKEPNKILLLDVGGAGGHQFDRIPIINKTRIDIDENKLKESKGWNIKRMDANSLKFKKETFNLISCFQVLEHTKDPLKIMKEMYRVLKKDGKIWITVPDLESVGFKFYDYYTHIFPFTRKRVEFMIKSCGFKDLIIKKYSTPKYWFILKPFPKILLKYVLLFTRGSLLIIATK